MSVLAHAGHWLPQLLYLAPVVFIAGAVLLNRIRGGGESDDLDFDRERDDAWEDATSDERP